MHAAKIAEVDGAQSPNHRGAGALTVAQLLDHFHVPGVSVAVIHGFEVAWTRSWGVADAESGTTATDQTLYQAASISKPVTALAALKAAQSGLFDLDQDINTILTTWKLPDAPFGDGPAVTLRTIMSHTSGLGDGYGFPGYAPGEPLPTVPQILGGEPPSQLPAVRLVRPPMTSYAYSGGGIEIEQLVLTDVIGAPFAQIMQDWVLQPIGMASSTFEQPLPSELEHLAASAHNQEGGRMSARWHVYPEQAAAGLWTTAGDLARFLVEVQRTLDGRSSAVVNREHMLNMVTPVGVGPFGVGFVVSQKGDGWYFEHDGDNWGFKAQAIAHVTQGYGTVIMANGDNGQPLLTEIQNRISRAYEWDEPASQSEDSRVDPVRPKIEHVFERCSRQLPFEENVD